MKLLKVWEDVKQLFVTKYIITNTCKSVINKVAVNQYLI